MRRAIIRHIAQGMPARRTLRFSGHRTRWRAERNGTEKRERRNEQFRESKKKIRAAMTPEEKAITSKTRAERRRKQREREQAEAAAALADRTLF